MRVTSSSRAGFTLAEMIVALFLFSLIAGGILTLVTRQQRFYRDTADIIRLQGQLRQGASVLPLDLRAISTSDTLVNSASTAYNADIYLRSDYAIEFRRMTGSSVACKQISTDTLLLVPKVLDSATTMTAWANDPVAGDSLLVFDEGVMVGGGDDRFRAYEIRNVQKVSGLKGCPWRQQTAGTILTLSDTGRSSYRLALSPSPLPTTLRFPLPVRVFRRARYEIYQADDQQWYLGYSDCLSSYATASGCSDVAPVSGPYAPFTGVSSENGLVLTYYDASGNVLSSTDPSRRIARIGVTMRGYSDRALSRTGSGTGAVYADSSVLSIGIRNRR